MKLVAYPATPYRIGKHPPAPEKKQPAIEESRAGGCKEWRSLSTTRVTTVTTACVNARFEYLSGCDWSLDVVREVRAATCPALLTGGDTVVGAAHAAALADAYGADGGGEATELEMLGAEANGEEEPTAGALHACARALLERALASSLSPPLRASEGGGGSEEHGAGEEHDDRGAVARVAPPSGASAALPPWGLGGGGP